MNTEQINRHNILRVCSVLERLGVLLCTSSVVIGDWTGVRHYRKFSAAGGLFGFSVTLLYVMLTVICFSRLFLVYIYIYIYIYIYKETFKGI
jgi:hypothetical protein